MKDILQNDLEEKHAYLNRFSLIYCQDLKRDLYVIKKNFNLDSRPLYNSFVKTAYDKKLKNPRIRLDRKNNRIMIINIKDDKIEIIKNLFNGNIR